MMRLRYLTLQIFLAPALYATGGFLEFGSLYQNTQSFFGAGDTASVNGKYFAANASLGYEARSWSLGLSAPFASRTADAEYFYAATSQKISGSVTATGMSDPSLWGSKDIFGGNRYTPAVSVTASASAPIGKTALSLQTWQARPGLMLEYPAGRVYLAMRAYAAIPFSPKSAVEGQYSAYAGAALTTAYTLLSFLQTGVDISYAAGDFVRADASLRLGGFIGLSLPFDNVSMYLGAQSEVVRSDRDFFAQMSIRYRNLQFSSLEKKS